MHVKENIISMTEVVLFEKPGFSSGWHGMQLPALACPWGSGTPGGGDRETGIARTEPA